MYTPASYAAAVVLMIVTMLCWGSWANTQKLAKSWRFELFYWDYSFGVLLTSLLFLVLLGPGFFAISHFDLSSLQFAHVKSAFLGGMVFNVANILLVAAISLAGMSIAFPVGIGIALVVGTALSFMISPIGHMGFLALGVLLILAAILLAAKSYGAIAKQTHKGSKGLVLSVVSGVLMGLFYPLVARSMAGPEGLDPYTANVFFSLGLVACNLLANPLLMKNPFEGNKLTLADYCKGGMRNHVLGLLGGLVWCTGMTLNVVAAHRAGPAIAYAMGQGATLVAAIWGVFIWREFKAAPQVNPLLTAMFFCYAFGLLAIGYARLH